MAKQRKVGEPKDPAIKARVRDIWFSLPAEERTARRVAALAKEQGLDVGKSAVDRWSREWRAETAAEGVAEALTPGADDEIKAVEIERLAGVDSPASMRMKLPADLVPTDLAGLIPHWLMGIAEGDGVNQVENAISKLSRALAARADDLVQDHKTIRLAVGALHTLSGAMNTIVQSRSVVSASHRNFAEGNRLLAEADKLKAEAQEARGRAMLLEAQARAESARDITPGADDHRARNEDAAEAMAALAGMAADEEKDCH